MSKSRAYDFYLASPQWAEKRKQRLEKDKYTCQMCGAKDNLQVHHRTYESLCDEDVERDLITLCERCHTAVGENATAINVMDCEFTFYHPDEGEYVKPMAWDGACRDLLNDGEYRAPRGVLEEGCGCPMWAYRRKGRHDAWRLMTLTQFSALLKKGAERPHDVADACFEGGEDFGLSDISDYFAKMERRLPKDAKTWAKARIEWLEYVSGQMPHREEGTCTKE